MDDVILYKNIKHKILIGKGSYGRIYSGEIKNNSTYDKMVIKRNIISSKLDFLGSVKELDILSTLSQHPCIVQIKGITIGNPFDVPLSPIKQQGLKNDTAFMIMEEATTDLVHMIYDNYSDNLDYSLIKLIFIQILVGIEYLHSRKIIHRDIKPANILWCSKSKYAKICDFGMCLYDYNVKNKSLNCQTTWYRSPEISAGYKNYNEKVDIWSVAMIMYEMINKQPFIPEHEDKNILQEIFKRVPEFPDIVKVKNFINDGGRYKSEEFIIRERNAHISKWFKLSSEDKEKFNTNNNLNLSHVGHFTEFVDLFNLMTKIDPKERITAKEAILHPFFRGFLNFYSNIRNTFVPFEPPSESLVIKQTQERINGINIILKLSNVIPKHRIELVWAKPEVLFHSIEIFDRYLNFIDKSNSCLPDFFDTSPSSKNSLDSYRSEISIPSIRSNDSNGNCKILDIYDFGLSHLNNVQLVMLIILYINAKFFSNDFEDEIYSFKRIKIISKVLSEKINEDVLLKMKDFETNLISNILNYKIFKLTPFEILCLEEENISQGSIDLLLSIYSHVPTITISQKYIYYLYKNFTKWIKGKELNRSNIKEFFKKYDIT